MVKFLSLHIPYNRNNVFVSYNMGQTNTIMNIHICGLDTGDKDDYNFFMETIDILFPSINKKKSTSDYTIKFNKKTNWNSFIYSDNNTRNFELINKTIQKQINLYNGKDKKERLEKEKTEGVKNHIILLFAYNNNVDQALCEEFGKEESIENLNENFPLLLLLFKDSDKKNVDYKYSFFDFSYIKCVNLNKQINLLKERKVEEEQKKDNKEKELSKANYAALYLQSLLYNDYDSYFTQRGYKLIDQLNPLSKASIPGIYLPIILVGSPGVGKSTFINILNECRISKASSSDEPVTSKSAVYDVKIPGNDSQSIQIDDERLKQDAFIRFIDTPGFDLEKDIEISLKEIKKIFNDFREGKERIPVVLYFMNPVGRNSSRDEAKQVKVLEILKFIKKNNSKIIFVITHMPKRQPRQKKNSFIQ